MSALPEAAVSPPPPQRAPSTPHPGGGLDGGPALRSSVCRLSAEDGRLSYRGYDVRELGEVSTYEETAYLLLEGRLPTGSELRQFTAKLKGQQKLTPLVTKALRQAPAGAEAMSALRSALAAAAMETPVAVPPSREAALTQGMRLLSQTPTIVAGWHRVRSGLRPLLPKKSLSYAGNFLAMLLGTEPDAGAARSFDVALILRADNELNPSTFAARVTAATGADVFGCILAALSALAGPRHGWHARRVMAVLEELREPESVEGWVRSRKESGGKIAGFGHQVYRGEDPRTAQLRLLARERCALAGLDALFDTAAALEEAVQRELGQYPIVDFYLAPLYRALGIPTDLFTAVFAVSRMSGWIAHVLEQYGDDKLIRPRAEYVGPLDLSYVPLRRRRA